MTALGKRLASVSEFWLQTTHPLREQTIQALMVSTGFSRRSIEMALSNCFEELSEEKLDDFITSSPVVSGGGTILHILPSNVFTAWLHGAVMTLLLGYRCALKPSSREPVFARAWQESLELVDPSLFERVSLVSWDKQRLSDYHAVIAYGSDETLAGIRAYVPPSVRWAGYGHKLSVGVVFEEALQGDGLEDVAERVARDVQPFQLQGCLSPQILYVQSKAPLHWPILAARVDQMPRLKPFQDLSEIIPELRAFTPHLSQVAYAGTPAREGELQRELEGMGISRYCELGEMQRPPLTWRNGGIFLPDLLN